LLIDQEQIESTLLEKKILMNFDHPFISSLVWCFQTIERVFFVMRFYKGGELFNYLRKVRIFDEEKVRFYAAQIGLAIQHLHSSNIIYRDLKPENILFDEDGYLVLTDFGMAKALKDNEKTKTFCGTPEYLSPEILAEAGYDRASDWWGFGILMYEMLCGIPPFYHENVERMYELIKHAELKFPKKIKISPEAQDLIAKLLDKNPQSRIGYSGGLNEIKAHPFFTNIDFDLIFRKKLIPPYKPEVEGKEDVHHFDEEFTSQSLKQSQIDDKTMDIIKRHQEKFADFTV